MHALPGEKAVKAPHHDGPHNDFDAARGTCHCRQCMVNGIAEAQERQRVDTEHREREAKYPWYDRYEWSCR